MICGTWQALLLHCNQLPQDRAGADHADESPQEELGRRAYSEVRPKYLYLVIL